MCLKFEFNSEAQVLALGIMNNNSTSSTSCLIVDIVSFDRLCMCKLERTNDINWPLCTLKRTEKNKDRKCIHTLSHFLAEVVYILHRI